MTVPVNSLAPWKLARNAIVRNLTLALKEQQDADFSNDPASPYQKAEEVEKACYAALRALAVAALRQIDTALATSTLITDITAQASAAKNEADRIAQATHTINDIAAAVDMVAAVVTKIAGLPFVGPA